MHVIVFTGHMIDNPARRGPGRALPERLPPRKIDAAARAIRAALDAIGAGPGDLGVCGAACGGDLLFAVACLDRGMRLELRLAREPRRFLAESVTFADPDHRWARDFARVSAHESVELLVLPQAPGEDVGESAHSRCNRWMLQSALSRGPDLVSFVALWDGQPGDGPGGTQHMVELYRDVTGRTPIVIDPAQL
jgi:hypothetical protein